MDLGNVGGGWQSAKLKSKEGIYIKESGKNINMYKHCNCDLVSFPCDNVFLLKKCGNYLYLILY